MMSIEAIATLLGVTTAILTVLTTLSKLQSLLTTLQVRDKELRSELEHQADRLELTCNGLRERIEHCNARLSNQVRDLQQITNDLEAYLQKNTSYERRSHG